MSDSSDDGLSDLDDIDDLEMIMQQVQSSSNIIERVVAEFMQFINAHQPALLVLILIDESSWIGVGSVSFLAFEIRSVRIRLCEVELLLRDVKNKAFFESEISQLSLNQKKQHVFNILNVKPLEIALLKFIELVIISTYSYPIQMLVVMPFDYLKFGDNDDSTFGVDISSRLHVDRKSIELLTFAPPMRDSPESIFIIADWCLTPHCTSSKKNSSSTRLLHDHFISSLVRPASNSGFRVSMLSRFIRNTKKSTRLSKSCSKHDQELEVSFVSKSIQDAEKLLLQVDHQQHLTQTLDVRALTNLK
nr:hypothetical protein [Tanacetum cinerariifolium]